MRHSTRVTARATQLTRHTPFRAFAAGGAALSVVLRNRRRVFAIVESAWDEFGPVAPIGEVDPDDALALDGPRGYEKTKD